MEGAILAIVVVVVLAWLIWDWRRTGSSGKTYRVEGDGSRPNSQYDYRLEYWEGDHGQGYQVIRNSDGQKLRWQTLPRSEGLEAIEVSGESHHTTDLQSAAFAPGEQLSLVREPNNPYDENAVAIMDVSESMQAGYIPGDEAERIANKLDRGEDWECYSMWSVRKGGDRVSLRVLLVGEHASVELST